MRIAAKAEVAMDQRRGVVDSFSKLELCAFVIAGLLVG